MASRAYAPTVETVVKLPPVLAFALGVPAAPRSAVEAVIERMIDALDEIDGDADREQTHDEGEPYFPRHRRLRNSQRKRSVPGGPGCPISDPDYGIEDQGEGTLGLDC